MLKVICAAATFAILSGSGVMAQNLSLSQADPIALSTSNFSWTGFYAGVNGGHGWGKGTISSFGSVETHDLTGLVGGVQVGYNQGIGGLVIGAEADFSFGNVEYSEFFPGFGTSTTGVENLATVRGRVGVPIDRLLPYVTGGLAIGTGLARIGIFDNTFNVRQTHVGWTLGAGLEYAVTDRLTVRGEYLYTDLGTATYHPDIAWPFGALPFDTKVNFGTVRGGINFKF